MFVLTVWELLSHIYSYNIIRCICSTLIYIYIIIINIYISVSLPDFHSASPNFKEQYYLDDHRIGAGAYGHVFSVPRPWQLRAIDFHLVFWAPKSKARQKHTGMQATVQHISEQKCPELDMEKIMTTWG